MGLLDKMREELDPKAMRNNKVLPPAPTQPTLRTTTSNAARDINTIIPKDPDAPAPEVGTPVAMQDIHRVFPKASDQPAPVISTPKEMQDIDRRPFDANMQEALAKALAGKLTNVATWDSKDYISGVSPGDQGGTSVTKLFENTPKEVQQAAADAAKKAEEAASATTIRE